MKFAILRQHENDTSRWLMGGIYDGATKEEAVAAARDFLPELYCTGRVIGVAPVDSTTAVEEIQGLSFYRIQAAPPIPPIILEPATGLFS